VSFGGTDKDGGIPRGRLEGSEADKANSLSWGERGVAAMVKGGVRKY